MPVVRVEGIKVWRFSFGYTETNVSEFMETINKDGKDVRIVVKAHIPVSEIVDDQEHRGVDDAVN